MRFPLSQLNIPFINAMVKAMYQEEARQYVDTALLTEAQMFDIYWSYMGYPL